MSYCYVYEHILDNEVFYVGVGLVETNRAYQLSEYRRSELWNKFVGIRHDEIKIKIVKHFNNYLEAERYEQKLTSKYHKMGLCKCNLAQGKAKYGKLNGMYGRKAPEISDEERQRRSDRMKGEKNPIYGKPSPTRGMKKKKESIEKTAKANMKKIVCKNDNKVFNSKKDAELFYGHQIPSSSVKNGSICRGKFFEYLEVVQ